MQDVLKSLIITILGCFLSPSAFALENLEPIANDRLIIDGNLSDWTQMRRQSAEYLLKGTIADMDDFQGGMRVAYNKDFIYFGIDCHDSELIGARRGDRVVITLQGASQQLRTQRSIIELTLNQKRSKRAKKQKTNKKDSLFYQSKRKQDKTEQSNQGYYFSYKLNRSSQSQAEIKSAFTANTYTIEIKIPLSELSWIYGSEVKLAAVFYDQDRSGDDSVYATHIVDGRNSVEQVSYIFGGAQLFKLIYQDEVPPFKVIKELAHDWVGDQRNELILVTDTEIVLFGDQINPSVKYIRYIHGWPYPEQIRFTMIGQKSASTLKVDHLKKDGSVKVSEQIKLQAGKLVRAQ